MKVTKDAVICGVEQYISNDIAPRMTGVNAFAIYFVLPSLDKKIGSYLDNFAQSDLFSDLFVDNGLELDGTKQRAMNALDKMGGKLHINFIGTDICLGKDDIDTLYRYIKEN